MITHDYCEACGSEKLKKSHHAGTWKSTCDGCGIEAIIAQKPSATAQV